MLKFTKILIIGLGLVSVPVLADTVFFQDFETGLGVGERTFSREWDSNNSPNWHPTNNWGVHDQSTNPWASGSVNHGTATNASMSGKVMGHIYANYDNYEQSYYEIDLNLASSTGSKLSFDFDSWIIDDDTDGFNVIAYNGSGGRTDPENTAGFTLLTPTGTSEMKYQELSGTANGGQLDNISSTSSPVQGFNGHEAGGLMAGTAMFNLSAYDGQMVTLRFSFGSNQSQDPYSNQYNAEGINIDNILVTNMNVDPPEPGIPEPTGLSLLGLGLLGFIRRRKLLKA